MPDYTDTNLSSTVYNVLTKARYDALANNSQINENELYLITDNRFVATISTTWSEIYDHVYDVPSPIFMDTNERVYETFYYDNNEDEIYFTTLGSSGAATSSIKVDVAYLSSTSVGWTLSSVQIGRGDVGAINSIYKLYLVGARMQTGSETSYSNSNVYATNGILNAKSFSVDASANIVYNSSSKSIDFTFV